MSNQPIIIEYGLQGDGVTYRLEAGSRRRIAGAFQGVHPSRHNVFVGYDTREDFENVHGPIWRQIAIILTGLSWEQIQKLGGARLLDPVSGAEQSLVA